KCPRHQISSRDTRIEGHTLRCDPRRGSPAGERRTHPTDRSGRSSHERRSDLHRASESAQAGKRETEIRPQGKRGARIAGNNRPSARRIWSLSEGRSPHGITWLFPVELRKLRKSVAASAARPSATRSWAS